METFKDDDVVEWHEGEKMFWGQIRLAKAHLEGDLALVVLDPSFWAWHIGVNAASPSEEFRYVPWKDLRLVQK